MQSLTQPTLLLKPFAESGDKNTIPVTNTDASNPQLADLTNGFPAITSEDPDDGGLPPERKDFNGLGYLTTTYDFFYQAGGTFTFNTIVSNAIGGYPLGAKLWYTNSNGNSVILTSTKANNQDNFISNPSYIGTSWKQELPFLDGDNVWTGINSFITPATSDNSTKAATTAWGNNFANSIRTNGVINIPQDIKLQLSSGTLTLKSGSKVYVPNGSGVFNILTINSDLTISGGISNSDCFLFVAPNNTLQIREVSISESGTSSTLTGQYRAWYDTTNNSVKFTDNTGTTWTGGYSFPLAVISCSSGSISGIDQVFNGFGYIGNTMFVLPGVVSLFPNGFNDDGTFKNTKNTTPSVRTFTWTSGIWGNNFPITINANGIGYLGNQNTFVGGERPTNPTAYTRWYNQEENQWYDYVTSWEKTYFCIFGEVDLSNGKVVGFRTKTAFNAANYNDVVKYTDKKQVTNWGMPDYSKMVALSAGTYTATENCILSFCGKSKSSLWSVAVNDVVVANGGNDRGDNGIGGGAQILIGKGTVYTVVLQWIDAYYIPCIGG